MWDVNGFGDHRLLHYTDSDATHNNLSLCEFLSNDSNDRSTTEPNCTHSMDPKRPMRYEYFRKIAIIQNMTFMWQLPSHYL